jgi:hypothetical protein
VNRDIHSLIQTARQQGVIIHPDPRTGAVIIHSHRDPLIQRSHVETLRRRRAEVGAALAGDRSPPAIPAAEERYRANVRHEPDVPLTELDWPVLAAMIISLTHEVVDARFAERDWDEQIAGRDVPPRPPARKGWVEL